MRVRGSPALAAVFAVVGFSVVMAGFTASAGRRAQAPQRQALIHLINARQSEVSDLGQAVRDLRSQVAGATRKASELNQQDRSQAAQLAELNILAGTAALAGPGVVVHLADASEIPSGVTDVGAYKIHDTDLQQVVNALFAAGAEAVSINGNRLVATSPIRAAGATIVVNFQPLSSPYDVTALGPDVEAFNGSEIARRFKHWTSVFGLGFAVHSHGRVSVPAYTGRTVIGSAVPADQPAGG